MRWLGLLLASTLASAQTWRVDDGAAGWAVGPPANGARPIHQAGVTIGPWAEVRFALRPAQSVAALRCQFGLALGDPSRPTNRACQLQIGDDGQLAWFDGQRAHGLWPVPLGSAVTIALCLDRDDGRLTVTMTSPGGESRRSAALPFWNQVGSLDDVYLVLGDGSAVESVQLESFPPRPATPVLDARAVGPRAVRLRWSCRPAPAQGYRLHRNGSPVATLGAGTLAYLDQTLAPRTRYEYRLEAVGAGPSRPVALVTPPETLARLAPGTAEVVVYGATPAGIAAAITLGRAGTQVLLIEPSDFIGGMMSGGLSRTDFGSVNALGGLFTEFTGAVDRHYAAVAGTSAAAAAAKRGGLYFEPRVARQVFEQWLGELPQVRLVRGAHIVGAAVANGRVRSITLHSRERAVRAVVRAPVFIDASYEGDLAALAGAPYRVGREGRADTGEPHAGKLWWQVWERRVVEVVGTGDKLVQAYNYRLCLTRDVANRRPWPQPERYERQAYLGLLRDLQRGKLKVLEDVLSILPLPGGKADANNHPQGDPSSDLIGGADAYPEANWATRETIAERHRDHLLGLLWFLRHDPEVPERMRVSAQSWCLARDEFPELESWPSQLYVREARRILGEVVFSELQAGAAPGAQRPPARRDSIAVGAYPMDSHATGGRQPGNPDLLEGFFYLARGETKPYQIPYGVLTPRGLDNVLVACALSATHIGYGTLRMEPVFMAVGTAAGAAAQLCLDRGATIREVPLARLQLALLRSGQVLTLFDDVPPGKPGREGFNLFGTFGAFPAYTAEPDGPLTGAALRGWLAAMPWPSWRGRAAFVPDVPRALTGDEVDAVLARLASLHGLPTPRLEAGAEVRRWRAMAELHGLVAAWVDRGATD